jgi:serine/threonine protein kinase
VKGTSTKEALNEDDTAASDDKITDDAGKQSFLCKFGWREVLQQWRMVVQALAGLHANRITHLDVKPSHIVIIKYNNDNAQLARSYLIDFGISKMLSSEDRVLEELIRETDFGDEHR